MVAGVVILLFWLYLARLLGGELNAQIGRNAVAMADAPQPQDALGLRRYDIGRRGS